MSIDPGEQARQGAKLGDEAVTEFDVDRETAQPEVRIGAGSALSLAARLFGLGTSFIIGVLIARTLGVAGKGTLYAVMQVPGLLLIALDLGISTSNIYFVSRGELKPGTVAANSAVIAAGLGVLGAPLIYLLLNGRFAVVPGIPTIAIVFAMLILPAGLFASWLQSVSIGTGNLVLPLWYSIASASTTLIGITILFATHRGSVGEVVAVSTAGTLVGVTLFLLGLRKELRPFSPDLSAAKVASGFSLRVYLSDLAGTLHNRQDVLVLGWLAGASAVGLYSVSTSFAELTWYIPSALGVAIIAKGGRTSEASGVDYVTRSARISVIFMAITATVSVVLVPIVIPLLYGTAFLPAAFAFYALLPGVLCDGVTRILWNYQTTRGRLYWRQAIASTVLNVIAVIALVPILGPVGAGLASTISYVAIGVFVLYRFCADTGARASQVLMPTAEDARIVVRTVRRLVTGDKTVD